VQDPVFGTTSEPFPLNLDFQASLVHNPGNSVLLREDGTPTAAQQNFPLPVTKIRTMNFLGGTNYALCSPFGGLMGEVILYARAVNNLETTQIEEYLRNHWDCCKI
jgi:hypothetical protein